MKLTRRWYAVIMIACALVWSAAVAYGVSQPRLDGHAVATFFVAAVAAFVWGFALNRLLHKAR